MIRGYDGILPRLNTLSDESYLDFVETFRAMNFEVIYPAFVQAADAEMQEKEGTLDSSLKLSRIREVIGALPISKSWQRFMRTHQEMMWRRVRESYLAIEQEHLDDLAAAEQQGPGRLIYDPDFHVPDYARMEIHLQPGGYTDDPIGGLVFHYGTKAFYQGMNDQNEHHIEFVELCRTPEDGKLDRVLDLACSIGQCTTNLKKRFPDAEVWGLDVALPLLRYAHKCAVDEGIDVNYVQALAEETGFEDNHFDMVLAYILFHEVPVVVMKKVIAEVFRILRPGGTFNIFEFPNASHDLPPSQRFLIDYDSQNNCEPYSPAFVNSDFHQIIKDAGFTIEQGGSSSNTFLQSIVATKPAG